MRPALREPLEDSLDLDLRQVSGLLRRQHLAVQSADTTVRSRQPLDDPFLLEKSNLDSSSFCCRHSPVVESTFSSSCGLLEGRESTQRLAPKSGRKPEIDRKLFANREPIPQKLSA